MFSSLAAEASIRLGARRTYLDKTTSANNDGQCHHHAFTEVSKSAIWMCDNRSWRIRAACVVISFCLFVRVCVRNRAYKAYERAHASVANFFAYATKASSSCSRWSGYIIGVLSHYLLSCSTSFLLCATSFHLRGHGAGGSDVGAESLLQGVFVQLSN